MLVPDNKTEIIKHLQGDWQRGDEKISFTIVDECQLRNIHSTDNITDTDFLLDFNKVNLKWQLTGPLFGIGSALINFEKIVSQFLLKMEAQYCQG